MSDDPTNPAIQDSAAPPQARPALLGVVALDLKRIDKGTVYASVTLYVPGWKLKFHEVLWGRRADGSEWVTLPSRSWTGEDGATRYTKLITWGDEATAQRFQRAALEAIHRLVENAP